MKISIMIYLIFTVLTGVKIGDAQQVTVTPAPTTESTPTPTPKPYMYASWLSEEENTWLRSATVSGGNVTVDLGDQADESECVGVPDAMIRLFKRYQQAHTFTVLYASTGFNHYEQYGTIYNLKSETLLNLPIEVPKRDYVTGRVTMTQMRAVAAGHLTFEQIWKSLSEANKPTSHKPTEHG